jgi:hypothetical protein
MRITSCESGRQRHSRANGAGMERIKWEWRERREESNDSSAEGHAKQLPVQQRSSDTRKVQFKARHVNCPFESFAVLPETLPKREREREREREKTSLPAAKARANVRVRIARFLVASIADTLIVICSNCAPKLFKRKRPRRTVRPALLSRKMRVF